MNRFPSCFDAQPIPSQSSEVVSMNVLLCIIVVLAGFVSSSVYAQTTTPKPQKFEIGTVQLLNTPTVLSATSKGKLIWKIKSPGNICSVLDHKQVGFVFNLCNSISVLNHKNGKVIWRRLDVAPEKIELFAKDRLLVETPIDGASASTLTTVINVNTGVNIAEASGFIIRNTPKYALLLINELAGAPLKRISLSRIDADTNKVEVKTLKLSARSGCGTEDDLTGAKIDHVDDQFIYAQVGDSCGVFDVKLDWTKAR
jgi:hypothetical protein